jgi:ParB/RepB/Spo0J family partition protein
VKPVAPKKDFAAMEARRPSGETAARAALRSRMAHPTSLRLDEVQPNPLNPRYPEEDPETRELAETLTKVGQLQPALVVTRDQYLQAYPGQREALGEAPWVVLVGNRRLAASRLAGRPSIDVRVATELATAEDFEDRILIENIQRKDLPPLLEAEHLQHRLSRPGQTVRSVGEAIGKSHTYVQQRLDLLKMIPEFQALFRKGEINIKTGRRLGVLSPEEQRLRFNSGPPFVGQVEHNGSGAPSTGRVNPVYSDPAQTVTDTNGQSEEGEAVNPVYNQHPATATGENSGTAGSRATPSRPRRSGTLHDDRREVIRLSVGQWLDNALGELDQVLPTGGGGDPLGHALEETQRHILAAREALRSAEAEQDRDRTPAPL